jgi:DNA excision repair protein ERCC-4
VKDLATVQGLVSHLLRYDAVTFLTLLEGVRLSEGASSIWLFHEATHIMYEQVGYVIWLHSMVTNL